MAYGTPARLYTSADLLEGYDPGGTYRTHVEDGGTTPKTFDIRREQAVHDAHIAVCTENLIRV